MTAYALLPDNSCDHAGYPSDAEMRRDLQAIRRAEHATERDRVWQSFLRLRSTRLATVDDVQIFCDWWFLRGALRGKRWRRR